MYSYGTFAPGTPPVGPILVCALRLSAAGAAAGVRLQAAREAGGAGGSAVFLVEFLYYL